VEVTASIEAATATAESVVLERKLAPTVSDAISSEEISRSTASDAAGALEKVTGVSVVGDGYVYVRGLGERYSGTMLNNALITTTEPEKRVVPLDLFPANLIDKIEVVKTYSADLPGEFSGGLVKMQTVEFPTHRVLRFSMETGFNSQTTGKEFRTYPGGSHDALGFDDGTRDLPSSIPTDERLFRGDFTDAELGQFGTSFPVNWDLTPVSSARPSQSYSVLAGNTFGKLGVIGAVTFSNGLSRRPGEFNTFNVGRPGEQALFTNYDDFRTDTESARLGGILNLAYRFSTKHKIAVRNTLTRDADKEGRYITGLDGGAGEITSSERLRWVERQLLATQIEGEHLTGFRNSIFTWQLGYSKATRDEPDLREVIRTQRADGRYEFSSRPDSGTRYFSALEDRIWEPSAEWSLPFFKGPVVGSFNVGFRGTFRDRDFTGRRFRYLVTPGSDIDRFAPTNEILTPENLASGGVQFREFTRSTDSYTADMTIYGGFFDFDVALGQKWRIIAGLRVEDFEENVTTIDPLVPGSEEVTSTLSKRDPLPAVNLVYHLTPNQNLRFGFGGTVSRPDFRELSPFSFTEVVGGFSTNGNPDLRRTSIHNFDARWEWFLGGDQLIAASYFYKNFTDPIELVLQPGGNQRRTWINAAGAKNQGLELEFRRNLGFLASSLSQFNLATNFTFVDSNIEIPEDAPFELTNLNRPLIGQSRYLFNGVFEWVKPRWRSNTRLFAHYFSKRISEVGTNGLDDVYEEGRPQIDFVYEFMLREAGNYKIRFEGENLTDEEVLWTQGGENKQFYRWGRTFRVGLSFSLLY
jgi:outer membrane receptor protein involved in Fe transport